MHLLDYVGGCFAIGTLISYELCSKMDTGAARNRAAGVDSPPVEHQHSAFLAECLSDLRVVVLVNDGISPLGENAG